MWTTLQCLLVAVVAVVSHDSCDRVLKIRNELMDRELEMMLGSDVTLSDNEIIANDIIMDLKIKELERGMKDPGAFNFSNHFFEYKDQIKNTQLYQIIQRMPKGAALHAHDTGLLGPDYVVGLTYMDHLYVCFCDDQIQLIFAENTPKATCGTQWQLMKEARFSSGDVEKFDANLRTFFTIVIDNPNEVYTDINKVWSSFSKYFIETSPLFAYKPVWDKYFYDSLLAFREDGIMFIEIRSVLPPLYDLKGNYQDAIATAESFKAVIDQFVKDYPDFHGAKLIYAPHRLTDRKTIKEYIRIAKEIKRRMPDFVAGFDLVGQEDLGVPIKDFLDELAEAQDDLDFFFHAGETNWNGMSTDENLYDAIALGTKRIGHGFALIKHPYLMNEIVKRDIAIEVNVVSNNVLKLVEDVRNHPLASYLAQGLPVVLSSDDPGVWEANPITHDFYVTFVGVSSRHADLRLLKQLALNSLYYSTYENKDKMVYDFEIRWTKFIDSIVREEFSCKQ